MNEMQAHLLSLPNGGQDAIGSKWSAGDIMYRDLNEDGKISKERYEHYLMNLQDVKKKEERKYG